jgi:hypothetical protein
MIKSRRMRWVGHVAREMHRHFLSEKPKGRDRLEDLGVDEKILLKWKEIGCEAVDDFI